MRKILFVDDEVQILKAINRIFADSDYRIYFSGSAEAALQVMSSNIIDMVITDMRMPGMDGIELLKLIKLKYPRTIRVILSGFADEQVIMYSLKNNIAKTYLFKPWDNEQLIKIVEENLEIIDSHLPVELISYINSLDHLPTINSRYQEILKAIQQDIALPDLAEEIEKDQAITAKILQIVNSANYGIKTGSIKKALSIIGIKDLHNLILSMGIMDCIPTASDEKRIVESIWNHAFYTHKIHHIMNEHFLHIIENHQNDMAGLLHNIGIVLLINFYAADYIKLLKKSQEDNKHYLYQLEQEEYGFTHTEVSEYLSKWWNAPDQITETSAFHVAPLSYAIVNRDLVCKIHIAQHYAGKILGLNPFCEFNPETFDVLGIDRMNFENTYRDFL